MNRTVDPRDVAAHGRLDQRGEDLASGAAGVNLVGYITVSSRSPEALARDKRTIRASAGKSYLKLEWCDREHHRAFVNTLAVRHRHPSLSVEGSHAMRDPLSALTDAFTGFLFGKVETTRLPVRTSTGQAQAVYLPTAAPGLGDSGVIIGREVYSGKGYIYDPFQLYGQQLPAPHWLVLGESGNGKSALEKTYVLRQLRFRDRQVVVLDAQGEDGVGEWNLIAAGAGHNPHPPGPDGRPGQAASASTRSTRRSPRPASSPCSARSSRSRWATASTSAPASRSRSRTPTSTRPSSTASRSSRTSSSSCATPKPESAEAMNVAIDDVRAWGLDVALVLDRLVDGDLRGMFDGPTTVGIDLDAPLIVFDLSHIDRNSIAMPILMAIVGVWLEHTWIRPDRKKRIFLVEEAWHIINSPFVAQLFQRLLKFGRRLGPVLRRGRPPPRPTWSTARRRRRPRRS